KPDCQAPLPGDPAGPAAIRNAHRRCARRSTGDQENGGRANHVLSAHLPPQPVFPPRQAGDVGLQPERHSRLRALCPRSGGGGQRGHAPSLDALLDDIDAVVVRARSTCGGPLVLIGHSFGGLLAVAYALDRPAHLDKAVFSAPALLPRVKVPAWKRALAGVLPTIAPRASFANQIDPRVLSHDPAVAPAYVSDPLVHNRITAGLYASTLARGDALLARA